MNERDKVIGIALFTLLFVSWFAFAVHTDARFAGSLYGGVLGIAGASLMLIAFLYTAVKRVRWLKNVLTRAVSMRTFLALHVYAGVLGAFLALLHTGHKFESGLGIALTTVMLILVLSGFVGHYLMTYLATDTRETRGLLSQLEQQYHATTLTLAARPDRGVALRSLARARLLGRFTGLSGDLRLAKDVHDLSESMADLEFSLSAEKKMKLIFKYWLTLHILLAFLMLALLALHVWSGFYFGIRWLQ